MKKIRKIIVGIKNILKYSKILYNDRDWDQDYLFILLHKKIESMEYNFRYNYYESKGNIKRSQEMKIAKLLIERILNRDYIDNSLTAYTNKYPTSPKFCNFILKTIKKNEYFILEDLSSKQQKQLKSKCYNHSDYMKKQDVEYLFNLLSKHILDWWD